MNTANENTRTKFPTDPALAAALVELRTKQGITNPELARMFGTNSTFISKYLNNNLDHDPKDFADKAWDTLRGIAARLDLVTDLFETSVVKTMAGRFDLARRTQDVCLITGDAGWGKSCGGRLYAKAQPSTLYGKLSGRQRDADDMESLVFGLLETHAWKGNSSRYKFMVDQLKGSGRLLIVDNGHRLDTAGRNWLCDFNEDTGIAIGIIANKEIEDKIRGNDQQFSRVGSSIEVSLSTKEVPKVAQLVAEQFSDADTAEELADLAAFVAEREGHLRAVRKRVIFTQEVRAKDPKMDARQAFRWAHSNLLSNYALPGD